jgi:hypothetical protein
MESEVSGILVVVYYGLGLGRRKQLWISKVAEPPDVSTPS